MLLRMDTHGPDDAHLGSLVLNGRTIPLGGRPDIIEGLPAGRYVGTAREGVRNPLDLCHERVDVRK
jgi:hypothetical protein